MESWKFLEGVENDSYFPMAGCGERSVLSRRDRQNPEHFLKDQEH